MFEGQLYFTEKYFKDYDEEDLGEKYISVSSIHPAM